MAGSFGGVIITKAGKNTNLHMFQGRSIAIDIIVGGSSPIDVTGYTATFKAVDNNGVVMLEMSSANGRVTVGGVDGLIQFRATKTQSTGLNDNGIWVIKVNEPSGDESTTSSGIVSVELDIT